MAISSWAVVTILILWQLIDQLWLILLKLGTLHLGVELQTLKLWEIVCTKIFHFRIVWIFGEKVSCFKLNSFSWLHLFSKRFFIELVFGGVKVINVSIKIPFVSNNWLDALPNNASEYFFGLTSCILWQLNGITIWKGLADGIMVCVWKRIWIDNHIALLDNRESLAELFAGSSDLVLSLLV